MPSCARGPRWPVPGAGQGSDRYTADFDLLAGLLRRFFAALGAVEDGEQASEQQVADVVADAVALRDRYVVGEHLRPWVGVAKAVSGFSASLVEIMEKYLRAFEARIPLEAQRLAEQAQQQLDDLAASGGGFAERLFRVEQRYPTLRAPGRCSWVLIGDAATAGPSAVQERGAARSPHHRRRTIGRRRCDDGVVRRPWVEAMGEPDPTRSDHPGGQHLQMHDHRGGPGSACFGQSRWSRELRKAFSMLANVTPASEAAIGAAVNGGQETEAVLADFLHGLYEGPARRLALIYLCTVGKAKFERDLATDGAHVMGRVDPRQTFATSSTGMDKDLRVAFAHKTFEHLDRWRSFLLHPKKSAIRTRLVPNS